MKSQFGVPLLYNMLVLVGLSAFFQIAQSQPRIQPLSKTSNIQAKSLIVETVHPYTVQDFSTPLVIVINGANESNSFEHPEVAVRTFFSAIGKKDYNSFLNCWTKDSQQLMLQKDKSANRSPSHWQDTWEKTFFGKKIEVTHWINYGRYVLLNYRIYSNSNEDNQAVLTFVQENGQWKLTQDLREDPLPSNWRDSSGRIRQPASSLFSR